MNSKIEESTPSLLWQIPRGPQDEGPLDLSLNLGDVLFIFGPNGSGKSALIQHLVKQNYEGPIKRISAHRQTWMVSSAVSYSSMQRVQFEQQVENIERQDKARYQDERAPDRLASSLYDLVAAENKKNKDIADLVRASHPIKAQRRSQKDPSIFEQINELFRLGSLSIRLEGTSEAELKVRSGDGKPFNIAQMSDGERNAVILASDILTAKPNTLFMIDEPERHLHRSIIVPLVSALIAHQRDCIFVISSHELNLALAAPAARILLPRSCRWEGEAAVSWSVDLLDSGGELPDDLKLAVLGSRRRILFVEGDPWSRDQPLYAALFPEISIVPVRSCGEVIRSVKGLRGSEKLHWITAYGLIDRDDRNAKDIQELAQRGVFALDVHSVEALYYCREARVAVANHQQSAFGFVSEELLADAEQSALNCLSKDECVSHLSKRRCGRALQEEAIRAVSSWRSSADDTKEEVEITVRLPYKSEKDKFLELIHKRDLDAILQRYPVKESPALKAISKALGFTSVNDYERAILQCVSTDSYLRAALLAKLQHLADEVESGTGFE